MTREQFIAEAVERGLTQAQAEEAADRAEIAGSSIAPEILAAVLGDNETRPHLHIVQPASDPLLATAGEDGDLDADRPAFDLAAALDAIPLTITVWHEVDLDAEDPAAVEGSDRRRCIAQKVAGGHCTSTAMHSGLLCSSHAGVLDPSAGGRAVAEKRRAAQETAEERDRLARLGTRGVIRDTLATNGTKLKRTVEVLLDAASQGDLQAAKLLGPYINQAHGMPTESVAVSMPTTVAEVAEASTESLVAALAAHRAKQSAAS